MCTPLDSQAYWFIWNCRFSVYRTDVLLILVDRMIYLTTQQLSCISSWKILPKKKQAFYLTLQEKPSISLHARLKAEAKIYFQHL